MTVQENLPPTNTNSDGVTATFNYDFKVLREEHLSAIYTVIATGDSGALTIESVTGIGDDGGGTVTFADPPADGMVITIDSIAPLSQVEAFNGNKLPPATVERMGDAQAIQNQRQQGSINRTLRFHPTDTTIPTLPPAVQRQGKLLGFSDDGTDVEMIPGADDIKVYRDEAVQAATDATDAWDNINANLTAINAVVANETNINTVAGIDSDVTTVAGIAADVTAVADNEANINAAVTNATNINTVAGNIANVNAVGTISADVTAVAGISDDIQTVAGISDQFGDLENIATQAAGSATSAAASEENAENALASLIGLGVAYKGDITSRIAAKPVWDSFAYEGQEILLPGTTFARSSTATVVNRRGLLESVSADVIRIQYDIQTKGLIGWSIEGAFTNLSTHSQDLTDGSWTKFNSTITSNAVAAPDGTMTADKVIDSALDQSHEVYKTFSVTSGKTYVSSHHFKAGEYGYGYCCLTLSGQQYLAVLNLTTGVVEFTNTIGGPLNTGHFVDIAKDGYFRLTVRMTAHITGSMLAHSGLSPSGTPALYNGRPRVIGDGTKGIYLWQSDFGEGWYPTSPVPTTTTAVARASDQKDTAASALGIPLDGSDFETCGEFVLAAAAGANSQYLVSYHDGTNSNIIFVVRDNTSKMSFGIVAGGVQSTTIVSQTITGPAHIRFACKVSASGCRMTLAVNGVDLGNGIGRAVTYGASTSDTIPTGLTTKSIGNRSTDYARKADCICVRDFDYVTALSSSDAEALTSFA
ncbi:phage head spike fiber domain-containing protein [Thalassospira aquimaris]|uniref:Tail fiber protein n=1 Tax=Thalassospira aquimaris TaxID=3037796 RepID=A0ABT6GHN0_9PROT|nr:hypothetical protein [Thalassospira sp. FZY0004]MDG4721583.1 hypothetical protein [Thalassospira sp. FZY0004]